MDFSRSRSSSFVKNFGRRNRENGRGLGFGAPNGEFPPIGHGKKTFRGMILLVYFHSSDINRELGNLDNICPLIRSETTLFPQNDNIFLLSFITTPPTKGSKYRIHLAPLWAKLAPK